jgi:hypothetical protein
VQKEERFFAQCIVPDGVRSQVKHLLVLLSLGALFLFEAGWGVGGLVVVRE